MSERIAIILNPLSGSAPDRRQLLAALEKAGIKADIHSVAREPRREWLPTLVDRYDIVVAAGGDGTVSAVASAAAAAGKVVGVLPTGTLNHFARDAGIPLDLDAAAAVLSTGRAVPVDVGVVNGAVFLNNTSIGAYPRMVSRRNRARTRGLPRPAATAVAILGTWLELEMLSVRLSIDGREEVRCSPFVVIGNGEYEVEGLQLGVRRTLTSGTLSLYVAPDLGRLDALALPLLALAGRLGRHEKFEAWTGACITVETARADMRAAVDGEIRRLPVPLRFSVRRRALQVIVPGSST